MMCSISFDAMHVSDDAPIVPAFASGLNKFYAF